MKLRLIIGAVALCTGVAVARFAVGEEPVAPLTGNESLLALGPELGLTFPSGTKLLGVHREAGMDDLVAVKVELPERDLEALLHGTPLEHTQFEPGAGVFQTEMWSNDQLDELHTAQAQLPGARVLEVAVRPEEKGLITVFVANYGT